MNEILADFELALWEAVPSQAIKIAHDASPAMQELVNLLGSLPGDGSICFNPVTKKAVFASSASDEWQKQLSSLEKLSSVIPIEFYQPEEGAWVQLEKSALAASTIFGPIASLGGWKPGPMADLFGGPNTLSATIGSGLLGAGLGYGAGTLGEWLSGGNLEKGKLRKNLALIGGAVGAAPALWAGARGWFEKDNEDLSHLYNHLKDTLPESLYIQELEKAAEDYFAKSYTGGFGAGAFEPSIPTDNLNRLVWSDPLTPVPVRAATTGLVEGASALRGGSTWVSPADVARIAAGMGAGYSSGLLVGKALGAVAGLRPEAQQTLRSTGMLAGMLSSLVPRIFGY